VNILLSLGSSLILVRNLYLSCPSLQLGKFVATYKGKVIASAKTSKKLFEKIKDKLGDKNLLIHHVDPKEAVCVY